MEEGKLSVESNNIADEKRQELLRIFPEVRGDGGMIDFDQLKRVLGESVDAGKERYGLSWPGKADCFRLIQSPSTATLLAVKEKSVRFDETQNLIIEGDNLEVLKLLQMGYQSTIKMIYIDPPYNTGKDFIYPDDYSDNLKNYLQYTEQADADGKRFSNNPESDGRFHSKWLNMMYPRLYLARNLLRNDGVIFMSIDGGELENLLRISDEVFSRTNRIGIITWKNVTDNNPTLITTDNEFIVCYGRNVTALPQAWTSNVSAAKDALQAEYERLKEEESDLGVIQVRIREFISDNEETMGFLTRYKNVDKDGVYTGSESVHNTRPGGYDFPIFHPVTKKEMRKPSNGYRFPEATFREMDSNGIILYGEDEKRIIKIKKYLSDYEDALRSVIVLDGRLASYELKRLFPENGAMFTNPKPTELIRSLISFAASSDSLILDFFGGSGSTADAVMQLNAIDGGTRSSITIQLPVPTRTQKEDGSHVETPAWNAGYKTIFDILVERVNRSIKPQSPKHPDQLGLPLPGEKEEGFRVFKLAPSNFKVWDAHTDEGVQGVERQMELAVNHIMPDRTAEDLFFEILIKSEYPLTAKVEPFDAAGISAFSVEEDGLIVCVERKVTVEAVAAIAKRRPSKVIFLDEAFSGNDQLKANAKMNFESAGVKRFETV